MKKSLLSIFFLLLFSTVFAQSAEKKADIQKLLDVTGSAKLGVQMVQQMMDAFQTNYSSVEKKFFDEMKNEFNAEELMNLLVPIYDKHYSHEEIRQLIAFYNTPIGKKVISTLPAISTESMQAGQLWGKKVAEKILTRMKEQGYLADEQQ